MAGSVNKVILIGNLGKDPEVRHLESGVSVASFPIATSENFKDRNTGERKSITDWHNIVLWRGLADVAEKYLKKGSKVYVEGKLKTRSWEDKEGNTRYTTEVVGDSMTMLDNKPQEGQPNFQPSNEGTPKMEAPKADLASDEEDDLPF